MIKPIKRYQNINHLLLCKQTLFGTHSSGFQKKENEIAKYLWNQHSATHNIRNFHLKKDLPTPKRVVVTGVGVVSPLGLSVETFWQNMLNGKCGIKNLPFDTFTEREQAIWTKIGNKIGGYIDPVELDSKLDQCLAFTESSNREKSITKSRLSKFIQFGMVAAYESIIDSGLDIKSLDKTQIGVSMGSSLGAGEEMGEAYMLVENEQHKKVSPVFYPRILNNMAAGYIAMQHDLQGPMMSCSTACATGAHSIGEAFQFIRQGHGKVMLAGGCENSFYPVFYVGFNRARALSSGNDPETASRPFDKNRDGFVMSEGAGCLVLEELEHAQSRGAKIYAELVGYGTSGDAYHPTAPSPDGRAAMTAMRNAIRDSIVDVKLSDINHVNCHATSTPAGDKVELFAIQKLFENDHPIYVNSMKGSLGHMLGAAGASESVGTVLSIYHNKIPHTLNFERVDDDSNLDSNKVRIVAKDPLEIEVKAALCNSFGFGGTNASLLFAKYIP
ncbi:hypothetical protein C9374_012588 [Naegleria lovaniensis]|uniref:beta-ketoacyl-[acyl-carrier-protein] synthase I n=1 Tax=Naegleria lovaniensis TaxID=51637 RepID=A0AA88H3J4_NAELO|nr:uncharacterized protein C9374_012588 [Naegleria lovaniensis]KAG2392336.1 hypothetical protein C9374_012588 [Naegleria lovaniensis]